MMYSKVSVSIKVYISSQSYEESQSIPPPLTLRPVPHTAPAPQPPLPLPPAATPASVASVASSASAWLAVLIFHKLLHLSRLPRLRLLPLIFLKTGEVILKGLELDQHDNIFSQIVRNFQRNKMTSFDPNYMQEKRLCLLSVLYRNVDVCICSYTIVFGAQL